MTSPGGSAAKPAPDLGTLVINVRTVQARRAFLETR
jgi:hypothetical protein